MDQKISPALIAPCGMNCALCLAFQREKRKCPGCRNDSKDKPFHCKKCSIVYCENLSENKRFCYECSKFPCARIKQLDKRYKNKYHMSMIDNLLLIKKSGVKLFTEKENKKWRCKKCGNLISVHRENCLICNEKVIY